MRHKLGLFFAALTIATTIAACGGYPEEQAADRCNIEQQNQNACFSDGTYDECVACFEQCGDSCAVAESCPVQYVCPKN